MFYLVDGSASSLTEIIKTNVHDDDVQLLTDSEILALVKMKVGDTITCGMVEINRLPDDTKFFCRKCDECGCGMNEGYCIDQGLNYYCSDECLHKNHTPEEYAEMYNDGDGNSFWTEWNADDSSEVEYLEISGEVLEIEEWLERDGQIIYKPE